MVPGHGGPQRTHSRNDGGPPPPKRAKSGLVITKYPPPPGYAGPAQPSTLHPQVPSWQSVPPEYNYSQPAIPYPTHSGHVPGATSIHPPGWDSRYQQPQAPHAYVPHAFQPAAADFSRQAAQHVLAAPPAHIQHTQQYPAWTGPPSTSSTSTQPSSWPAEVASQPNYHPSVSGMTTGATSVPSSAGQTSTGISTVHTGDDLEDDFFSEAYYAQRPDEINPALSIGIIDWKPPLPTRRALPSTFKEAELETLAPRNPPPPEEDSVSEYFTLSKRDEALLSVRQTALWDQIKDDLIFREFSPTQYITIPFLDLPLKYRDRRDDSVLDYADSDTASLASFSAERHEAPRASGNHSRAPSESSRGYQLTDESLEAHDQEQDDVLGSLRRAQSVRSQAPANGRSRKRKHSRASSASSISEHRPVRPRRQPDDVRDEQQEAVLRALGVGSPGHGRAHHNERDEKQEAILRSLGVSGPPQSAFANPTPSWQQDASRSGHSSAASSRRGSTSVGHTSRPHSSSQHGRVEYEQSWPHLGAATASQPSHSRASDVPMLDDDATPRADRVIRRKRSHEESDDYASDLTSGSEAGRRGRRTWDNDRTPRPRRKAARGPDARP